MKEEPGSSYVNYLAKDVCDTFGKKKYCFSLRQYTLKVTAGQKHSGQVTYQSLKTLAYNDLRRSDSLQAVAMSYREHVLLITICHSLKSFLE